MRDDGALIRLVVFIAQARLCLNSKALLPMDMDQHTTSSRESSLCCGGRPVCIGIARPVLEQKARYSAGGVQPIASSHAAMASGAWLRSGHSAPSPAINGGDMALVFCMDAVRIPTPQTVTFGYVARR